MHNARSHRPTRGKTAATNLPSARIQAHHESVWGGSVAERVERMHTLAVSMALQGRETSTEDKRASILRNYLYCCAQFSRRPFPGDEKTMVFFAIWLSDRLVLVSIKRYLGVVASEHDELELPLPPLAKMTKLRQVLRCIEKDELLHPSGRLRCPLTKELVIKLVLETCAEGTDTAGASNIYSIASPTLRRATRSMSFVGFFRPGELFQTIDSSGPKHEPVRLEQVWRGRVNDLEILRVRLHGRKNVPPGDPRCEVIMGATGHPVLCAVRDFDSMIAERVAAGEELGPNSLLFPVWNSALRDFEALRYTTVAEALAADLAAAGFDPKLFAPHSFRSGAATSAAIMGESEFWLRQAAGWSENSNMPFLYAKMAVATDYERAQRSANLVRPRAEECHHERRGFWARDSDCDEPTEMEEAGRARLAPPSQAARSRKTIARRLQRSNR